MVYKQTEEFTCGPSSFIEVFSNKKRKYKELSIHKKGAIKPSRIFLGISFLEVEPSLYLYIENINFTNGIMNLVFNPQIDNFKDKITKYYGLLISKHKSHIVKLKNEQGIISILKQAIQKNKNTIFLSDSNYWLNDGAVHWISLKGQDNKGNFLFGDSYTGKTLTFSENDILNILNLVRKNDFPMQIVTDFIVS